MAELALGQLKLSLKRQSKPNEELNYQSLMPPVGSSAIYAMDNAASWGSYAGGTAEDDTVNVLPGTTKSMKIKSNAGQNNGVGVYKNIPAGFTDLSDKNFNLWIYVTANDLANLYYIHLYFLTDDYTSNNAYMATFNSSRLHAGWNCFPFTHIFFSSEGSPHWNAITRTVLTIGKLNTALACNVTVADFRAVQRRYKAAVTLRFDDGNADLMTAARVMDTYGFRGVAGIITNQVGTNPGVQRASVTELQSLYAAGWDLVSHSHTHPPSGFVPLEETQAFISELKASRDWLVRQGFVRAANVLIPPYYFISAAEKAVALQYYAAISDANNGKWLNGGSETTLLFFDTFYFPLGLTQPTCYDIQGGSYTVWNDWLTKTKPIIDALIANKGYLTIVIHTVDATAIDQLCAYLASTGVPVVTYSQMLMGGQGLQLA